MKELSEADGLWACIRLSDRAGRAAIVEKCRQEYGEGFALHITREIERLEEQEQIERYAALDEISRKASAKPRKKSAARRTKVAHETFETP